jgi:hypothetical protein
MKGRRIVALIIVVAAVATYMWLLLFREKPRGPRPQPIPDTALNPKVLKQVGLAYAKDLAPLMDKACMDCHSGKTVFPWYHSIPGIKQYLDNHISEGREHLDLEGGFPFKSRKPIVMRIRGIGRLVAAGRMPLWDYSLMHPSSRLTPAEKQTIVDWSETSFQKLSETAKF